MKTRGAPNQRLHLTRRHYFFSEFNVSPSAAQAVYPKGQESMRRKIEELNADSDVARDNIAQLQHRLASGDYDDE